MTPEQARKAFPVVVGLLFLTMLSVSLVVGQYRLAVTAGIGLGLVTVSTVWMRIRDDADRGDRS